MEHSDSERKIKFLSKALESEKVRLARWLTASCAFAVLISALAVLTKSAFFFAVAALGWFLVWNRWKCWTFVRAVVAKPLPSNDAERMQWIDGLLNVMEKSATMVEALRVCRRCNPNVFVRRHLVLRHHH
jgi:hypothetical protein